MSFKTKTERVAAGEPVREGPFDGVPDHLHASLDAVLVRFAYPNGAFRSDRVRQLERITRIPNLLEGINNESWNYENNIHRMRGDGTLELLDAVLEIEGSETAQHVEQILVEAGSIFRVTHGEFGLGRRHYALERRIPAQVDEAIALLKHAQVHLQTARALVFGRSPDFKKALHECVCGLEAASIPIVQPNNLKATLGQVIGELKKNVANYTAEKPATVELFVALADSLWQLQSPHRHGAPVDRLPAPITREQAETAFWLTVTLSTWCERESLRRA